MWYLSLIHLRVGICNHNLLIVEQIKSIYVEYGRVLSNATYRYFKIISLIMIVVVGPAGRTVSGLFHLDQVTGKLSTTSNAFDRDVQIGGTEYYDIDVKATDQEYSADTTIRVRLTDVNDNMPVFSETVYNVEISEEDAASM